MVGTAISDTSSDRHGGGQGTEFPRLHSENLLINTPITADDNADDNRADMKRYVAAHTYRS